MRIALLASVLLLASPGLADDFQVTVEYDAPDADLGNAACDDGTGECTLRAAIQQANQTVGPDNVFLGQGVFALTLKRDTDVPDDDTGDLDVTNGAVTISGVGDDSDCDGDGCTAVDAKKAKDRAFDVHAGGDLVLQNLSVRSGKAAKDDFNETQVEEVSGGCIRVENTLVLEEVVVHSCKSPDDGGCIGFTDASDGSIEETFIHGCKTKDSGGGIEADSATVTLDKVTIAKSKAAEGGGIEATFGTLTLRNVTLSNNKGKLGGGVYVESDATVAINNSTFVNNKGKDSESIFVDELSQLTPITLENSLLRGKKELNCLGPIQSLGHNVDNGTTCPANGPQDCPDCDPGIVEDLVDNGGEVPTHAIESDSQAINRGDNATCETTDARGAPRVNTCDSGAFEFGGTPP
jgi:hypothetical protein